MSDSSSLWTRNDTEFVVSMPRVWTGNEECEGASGGNVSVSYPRAAGEDLWVVSDST